MKPTDIGGDGGSEDADVSTMLELILELKINGKIIQSGFLKQEQISLDAFLANRFGCYYTQKDRSLVNLGSILSL